MVKALKPCSCVRCSTHEGACPELVRHSVGRCDGCQGAAERRRGSARQRGYTSEWERVLRPRYLVAHPICCLCQAPASVPDHYPVRRRDLVAMGVADPDAWHRLRPLCKACHDAQTAVHQPGGWHAMQL